MFIFGYILDMDKVSDRRWAELGALCAHMPNLCKNCIFDLVGHMNQHMVTKLILYMHLVTTNTHINFKYDTAHNVPVWAFFHFINI